MEGERTMPALNTGMVLLLIAHLHPDGVVRVSREPRATDDPLVVLLTQTIPSKNQQAPITFSTTTTHIGRDQCRILESTGFGNVEGAHVENVDALELA